LLDEFYKETCRAKIEQPVFIIDYPVNMAPLSKKIEGEEKYVAKMQLVCMGMELINAYNDGYYEADFFWTELSKSK